MQRLKEELSKAGYEFAEVIADGKFHRGKSHSGDKKESAFYKAFKNVNNHGADFYVMVYGDWATGVTEKYCTIAGIKLDRHEKKRMEEQISKIQREIQLERAENQRKAAIKAKELFESASLEIERNEYLRAKGITESYGTRTVQNGLENTLLIPMRDVEGEIQNVERIFGDGTDRRGLRGGGRIGLFHTIGSLESEIVYVAEGFSTAVAIYKATNTCTIAALGAGNLIHVCQALIKKYPSKKYVICADNDCGGDGNVGVEKAMEAAATIGAKFVVPELDGKKCDFHDVLVAGGPEEVQRQINGIDPGTEIEALDVNYVVSGPYPDLTMKNEPKGTMVNFVEMMRRIRYRVRYNIISKEEEILIPNSQFTVDNQANAKLAYVIDWCERVGLPTSNIGSYITAMADANAYNPVADWIESRAWDGVSRAQEFYETIKAEGEDSNPVIYAMKCTMMKRWMISGVAALYEQNGVSAHGMLVLQGKQYIGKTKWLKSLLPRELNAFKDGIILDPNNKDSVFQALSNFIVELGEVDATLRKADLAQLKAFMTKDQDVLRRPYAKKESSYARRTIFCASVNESAFLKDPTGNRRFWTIACDVINFNHDIDMQQLWAEFAEMYRAGEAWYLEASEMVALNDGNEEFMEIDPVEERILSSYEWESERQLSRNATQICQEIGIHEPKRADANSVCRVLKKMGIVRLPRTKLGIFYKMPRQKTAFEQKS